jgi:hypothetical protein
MHRSFLALPLVALFALLLLLPYCSSPVEDKVVQEAVDLCLARYRHRFEVRTKIGQELVEDRLSLAEAVRLFRALDERDPLLCVAKIIDANSADPEQLL